MNTNTNTNTTNTTSTNTYNANIMPSPLLVCRRGLHAPDAAGNKN